MIDLNSENEGEVLGVLNRQSAAPLNQEKREAFRPPNKDPIENYDSNISAVDKQRLHLEFLKKSIGPLEHLRHRLGLSQRKMSELLLADPTSWSRWIKKPDSMPSTIYQSLFWYLQLRKLNVADSSVAYEKFSSLGRLNIESAKIKRTVDSLDHEVRKLRDELKLSQDIQLKLKRRMRVAQIVILVILCLALVRFNLRVF